MPPPAFASPVPVLHSCQRTPSACPQRPCVRASLPSRPPLPVPLSSLAEPLPSLAEPLSSYSPEPQPDHTPRRGRAPRSPDYYVNIGRSIESLRADYPDMLVRHPQWAAYAPNVSFKDRATGYSVSGMRAYERLLWAVRMQAALCFSSSAVQIHSLYHDDEAGVVYLRWRLEATPRVWGLVSPPPRIAFDSMSVYGMDEQGRIAEHVLDNEARSRPRKLRPFIEDVLSMGSVSVPEPISGAIRVSLELPTSIGDDDGRE